VGNAQTGHAGPSLGKERMQPEQNSSPSDGAAQSSQRCGNARRAASTAPRRYLVKRAVQEI
jgi:hypothetical protein